MDKQVLSAAQMQELIDMGIDVSKATMCWNYNDENSYWALVVNFTHSPYLEGEIIPTFTLQDILEMLPKIIDKIYFLKMFINCHGKMTLKYDKHPQLDKCCFGEEDCGNLLNAAFNMLKWCKQNKYI